MQPVFRVESRSYDQLYRGSWRGYQLSASTKLSEEETAELANDCVRLWLPASTPMHWATGTRPLRYNCLQLYWPDRWYTLSAFYSDRVLIHTYASIIKPATFVDEQISYVDLDLSILIKPDLRFEVLTQAEFEQMADILSYDEQTRIGAFVALNTLLNAIQLGTGLISAIPRTLSQTEYHLMDCYK